MLFGVILFFFYITFTNIDKGIDIVTGIVVVAALLVVTMHLISQTYRNNALLDKYDKLLEFIKKYETEIDNQRTVRHELKNQLLTIQSKILDNDKKENIIKYIDEILNDVKRMNEKKEDTGRLWSIEEIDALLADDYNYAEKTNSPAADIDEILKELDGNKEGFALENIDDITDELEEEENKFVVNSSDYADDVTPLLDSTVADEKENNESEVKEEKIVDVPGQLTIEKTRIINEVETRSVRNENIEHNIGKSKIKFLNFWICLKMIWNFATFHF